MSEKDKLNKDVEMDRNDILDEEEGPVGGKINDEPTCGEKIKDGIRATISTIYFSLLFVFKHLKAGLGCVFYPLKERCQQCTQKIDLCFNPYKDATLHEI